jgi:hypothetical protein
LAATLFWLGRAQAGRSSFQTSAAVFDEAVAIHEELGDLFGLGWSLTWTGILARLRGDLALDAQVQARVLDICRDVPHVAAQAWSELSVIAAERGDMMLAADYITRAAELFRDLGDRCKLAMTVARQAEYLLEADPNGAVSHNIEALTILRDMGADIDLYFALETAAGLLLQGGRPAMAATIVGVLGEHLTRRDDAWEKYQRPVLQTLRSLLQETAYEREIGIGQRLGVRCATDAAISWLDETGLRGRSPGHLLASNDITPDPRLPAHGREDMGRRA